MEKMSGNSGYKEYVAGLMAGIAIVITGHPFDTVKVRLLLQAFMEIPICIILWMNAIRILSYLVELNKFCIWVFAVFLV